jgi:hypothetical protein
MGTSTRAVRSTTNAFRYQLTSQMESDYGASLLYNARKRRVPERNNRINYYEGDTDSDNESQGHNTEDSIMVKRSWAKKRKVKVFDDDSDEDISLSRLAAVQDAGPKEDGPSGKLFRGFPTEV